MSSTTMKLCIKQMETGKVTSLCEKSTDKDRPIVLKQFQCNVLHSLHKCTRSGFRGTIKLIGKPVRWPGTNKDVREWAHSCVSCQKSKVIGHNKCSIGSFKTPNVGFDHVHHDWIWPLPDSNGHSSLLTCVDHFTWWTEDITAKIMTCSIVKRWIAKFGCYLSTTTDRGR